MNLFIPPKSVQKKTEFPIELRQYQNDAISALRKEFADRKKRVVLCAATGSGKTVIASAMIHAAINRHGGPVYFMADRINLVDQTSRKLTDSGIDHGIKSGTVTVNISIIQSNYVLSKQWTAEVILMTQKLVIVDECHERHKKLEKWLVEKNIPAVGLSATPFSKGLGKVWQAIVNVATTDDLTNDKWLVPVEAYSGVRFGGITNVDMTDAPTNSMGEWSQETVASRALPIVGDVVSEWIEKTTEIFGGPVKTICFASTVAHAEELAKAMG